MTFVKAYLALATMLDPSIPPVLIAAYTSNEACLVVAEKYNRTDEKVHTLESVKNGRAYVCLEIVQWRD